MGFTCAKESYPFPKLKEILTSASLPNIYIKISGFAYVSAISWEYPSIDTEWIIKALYEFFGPNRLCWGSDFPVVQSYMTYKQSLEVIKSHCRFIPYEDKVKILGDNMYRILTQWVPS
jgi:predicted TIM-barrel fold metal-dependent hydrolase